MKKLLFTTFVVSSFLYGKATDLIVEEFSTPPTAYPSITDAINVAVDGDRIIIKNRFGNIPWSEDLTLNKSLTLISDQNDATFLLDGNITIVPTANKEVTIIGAEIYNNKDITLAVGTIATRSMKVNIYGCKFDQLILVNLGVISQVAGNEINSISMAFGDVIGNVCNTISISNYTSQVSSFNDTCYIMGNNVSQNANNTTSARALYYRGSGEHVMIKNNYLTSHTIFDAYLGSSATSRSVNGVIIDINDTNYLHQVYNNYIKGTGELTSGAGSAGHSIYSTALKITVEKCNVMNNEIIADAIKIYGGVAGETAIDATGSEMDGYFNKLVGAALGLRNNLQNSSTLVNKGNPAPIFTDIDLTRNDIGKDGGPTPYDNFQPPLMGAARVYLVEHPFYIRQGNTLKVKAIGYDR